MSWAEKRNEPNPMKAVFFPRCFVGGVSDENHFVGEQGVGGFKWTSR